MPHYLFCPRIPYKQIELWGITSTSGNFRPYQIQTANIHFKFQKALILSEVSLVLKVLGIRQEMHFFNQKQEIIGTLN